MNATTYDTCRSYGAIYQSGRHMKDKNEGRCSQLQLALSLKKLDVKNLRLKKSKN